MDPANDECGHLLPGVNEGTDTQPLLSDTIRSYCEPEGYTVVSVFEEAGESAKTTDRPKFRRMLEYCRTHKRTVHFVVVYNLTRFSRNAYEHAVVRALLQRLGISLRSVNRDCSSAVVEGKEGIQTAPMLLHNGPHTMAGDPGPDTPDIITMGGGRQKRRGRPRRPAPGSLVSAWLDASDHDQLVKVSQQHHLSVSRVVRHAVVRFLEDWQRRQTKSL